MLSPVKTLARRVTLYLRRPISLAAYDVDRACNDERPFLNQTFLLYSSEDGQSDTYASSWGDGSSTNQTVLLSDHTSEDGQNGLYSSSGGELPSLNQIFEEEDLLQAHLIQIVTAQTSTCGSFIIDKDVAKNLNFPVASGGLGDVYKCTLILYSGATPEEVAIKVPRFPSLTDAEIAKINLNLDREINIWARLDHQYVLCLHGTATGVGPFRVLVSPWMPNGTLNSYLARVHETLTTIGRLRILVQITEGLKYLHDNNVIHGDLTSNNVLISADGSPRLADFGVSNIMIGSLPAFPYERGALRWAAPELITLHDGITVLCATKSSDIYALGCIMLQVLYGKPPYWWIKTALQVMALKFKYQEPINNTIEIQAYHLDFMRRCWSVECEKRPSVEEVLYFLDKASLHVMSLDS